MQTETMTNGDKKSDPKDKFRSPLLNFPTMLSRVKRKFRFLAERGNALVVRHHLLALCLCFLGIVDGSSQDFEWVRQFGALPSGPAVDEALATAARDGNIYVVGSTGGIFAGEGSVGATDAFLRKHDASGNVLWTRQFGTAFADVATAVSVDSTGIYVAGYADGVFPGQSSPGGRDAFVRKYDADGNVIWTRQFGTFSTDFASAILADSTGVYVAGFAYSLTAALPGQTSSGGLFDAFLRKYSSDGVEIWTRQFGSNGDDAAAGIGVDSTGVYVVGEVGGALPGQTSAGGHRDAFVRKYDGGGTEVWTRQFGTTAYDSVTTIAVDSTGVYLAGLTDGILPGQTSAGSRDAFARKYDADGNIVWTRQFGTSGVDQGSGISVDSGAVYVTGTVGVGGALPGQTSVGGSDAFLRRYDADGNIVWTRQFVV